MPTTTAPLSLKHLIGYRAGLLFPQLLAEIRTGAQTGRHLRLKRWITEARTQTALYRNNDTLISAALKDSWRSESRNAYYNRYADRFRTWFYGPHQDIIRQMVQLQASARFHHLLEIGCGDGQALEHCALRMPEIPWLTGIDLNSAIIARNSYAHTYTPRLRFQAANAVPWLPQNIQPRSLVFSYGGVMEYMTRCEVQTIFAALRRPPGVALALVEPLAFSHDLRQDQGSHVFGQEHSFSHNYARLLQEAGFDIRYHKELYIEGIRWIMLLTDPTPSPRPVAPARSARRDIATELMAV